MAAAPPASAEPCFLMVSGNDYRSRRQVNVHFIAQALAKKGKVRFFSDRFSLLAPLRKDPRLDLWDRANRIETVDGVDCFLWRTLLHPFNPAKRGAAMLAPLVDFMFTRYPALPCPVLDQWAGEATCILIESGLSPILFDRLKRAAPQARFVYIVSDSLTTLQCDQQVHDALARAAPAFDLIALPSPLLARVFPPEAHLAYIPHGLDARVLGAPGPSPYRGGINAVSVGSMLFDARFFEIAARARPDIQFHIIGAGRAAPEAANIIDHGEMRFVDTLPYLQHADVGIAPYGAEQQFYLADTSMKLMQLEALGAPAVCPHFAVGGRATRFGYEVGNAASIEAALTAALAAGKSAARATFLSWDDVAERLIAPERFEDVRLEKI
ncbi:MAG: glycosyltransferase family 1 protein [Hyphomonadaceae bacterium]